MSWSTISCLALSSAALSLLMAAAPAALRAAALRAAADVARWTLAVALAASLVLQLQAPAAAGSADGPLQPPLENPAAEASAPAALAEAPAEAPAAEVNRQPAAATLVEREQAAEAEAGPAPPADSLLERAAAAPAGPPADNTGGAAVAKQAPPADSRRVELPPDFAALDRQTVVIPQRPEWVDREPQMIDDSYCIAVSSAVEVRQRQCRKSLDERLQEAVRRFIREHLGDDKAAYFINYDIQQIRSRLVDEQSEFSDVVQVSLGPMHQSHALLKIGPEFRGELDAKWSQIRQTGRVVRTAGAAAGVLAALALMFGYFRLDTATKGYYTRRLQMVLAAAILALVAGGILYFRSAAELIYRLTM